MKWGIRRSSRVLQNNRRNNRVRKAKDLYEIGKISKEEKKNRIQEANSIRKQEMQKVKQQIKTKDSVSLRKQQQNISKQAISEVPHYRIKKGARTVKNIIFGAGAAEALAVGIAATPVLGPAMLGSAVVSSASAVGYSYIYGRVLDKLS